MINAKPFKIKKNVLSFRYLLCVLYISFDSFNKENKLKNSLVENQTYIWEISSQRYFTTGFELCQFSLGKLVEGWISLKSSHTYICWYQTVYNCSDSPFTVVDCVTVKNKTNLYIIQLSNDILRCRCKKSFKYTLNSHFFGWAHYKAFSMLDQYFACIFFGLIRKNLFYFRPLHVFNATQR